MDQDYIERTFVPDRECFICHVSASEQVVGRTFDNKSDICIKCRPAHTQGYHEGHIKGYDACYELYKYRPSA